MKKALLFIVLLIATFPGKVFSQTIVASLTGYPVVTTGWVIGGSASAIDSTIQLSPNTGSASGHIHYNTPLNVTACGSFIVDFDYKIVHTTGCLGDGISFFLVNPMTGFLTGGALGTPSPLTGLVFAVDDYDNDGDGNNPQYDLKGYPTATTPGYAEGPSGAGTSIAPLVSHVTYMADGAWHHIKLTYNGGIIRVYANGGTSPVMTGTFPITTSGYFGFGAGTGACISAHYIKSVVITAGTISPIYGVTTLCQGSSSPLTDSTAGGTWSSSNTSVATIGTSGVVTGAGLGTSVISYIYNSAACVATTTVNIVAPVGTISGPNNVCAGSTVTLSDPTTGGTWSSSNTGVATITAGGTVSG